MANSFFLALSGDGELKSKNALIEILEMKASHGTGGIRRGQRGPYSTFTLPKPYAIAGFLISFVYAFNQFRR